MLTSKDNIIYYSEGVDGGKLYAADLTNNNFRKLCEDEAYFINVVGEYIYYTNSSDNDRIYKIKLDRTDRTKLTDKGFMNVIVEDDYIYAADVDDYNIYKISVDGKIIKKINNDSALNLNVSEGYLYYSNLDDDLKIYRTTKDGSGRMKIFDESVGYINVVGDWIFYINFSDDYKIYKVKTDGTNNTKVSDLQAGFLNVANNGRLYFLNLETTYLHMIEDYGRGYSSTLMNSGYFPNVIDDYVYYVNENIDWFYKIINTEPQSGKFSIYVKSAEDIKINVVQGTQFSLPELVNITTIADSEDKANVIWNTPEIDTSKVG